MHADWWHSKINACANWTRLIARSTGNSNIEFAVVPYVQDLAGRIWSDQYIFTFLHEVKHAVLQFSVLLLKFYSPSNEVRSRDDAPSFLIMTSLIQPHEPLCLFVQLASNIACSIWFSVNPGWTGKKAGVSTLRPRNPYMNEISENLSTSMIS